MKYLSQLFMKGLAILIPVVGTIALLYWAVSAIEGAIRFVIGDHLPDALDFPGAGFLLGVALILAAGLLAGNWLARKPLEWLGALMERAPLVKAVYGGLSDLSALMSKEGGAERKFNQAVLVTLPDHPVKLVGFVTSEDTEGLRTEGQRKEEAVEEAIVYLPMSYQIGGYMAVVPKKWISPANLSLDNAMRFILTAGVSGRPESKPS